jgi:hypothetical protein
MLATEVEFSSPEFVFIKSGILNFASKLLYNSDEVAGARGSVAQPMEIEQPVQKIPNCSKPPAFDGTDPRFWIATIENAFVCNNIGEAQKLPFAVSYLGPGPGKHWSAHAAANKEVTWGDLQRFLLKYYELNGGIQEARKRWFAVRQGSWTVQEYIKEFTTKMEIVLSFDPHVTESEKVMAFFQGLRASMKEKCSYDPDPAVCGPYVALDPLMRAALAQDDTL